MTPFWPILLGMFELTFSQGQFASDIYCFSCEGNTDNSTCGDPFNMENNLEKIHCLSGACIKLIYSKQDSMVVLRTCSERMEKFDVRLVNYCLTQRGGEPGYLCMCDRNLCNKATGEFNTHALFWVLLINVITGLTATS